MTSALRRLWSLLHQPTQPPMSWTHCAYCIAPSTHPGKVRGRVSQWAPLCQSHALSRGDYWTRLRAGGIK
jgi:hypothetical protein